MKGRQAGAHQTGEEIAEIEVTPEMIEAGVKAYRFGASHDEFSTFSPEELVRLVLERSLAARG